MIPMAGKINTARRVIEDKKGIDVLHVDVRNISGITDYFLVASGNSAPHLRAMADALQAEMKSEGTPVYRRAGDAESGWIVIDCVDVIIHLFLPEKRAYYSIESLWGKARRAK